MTIGGGTTEQDYLFGTSWFESTKMFIGNELIPSYQIAIAAQPIQARKGALPKPSLYLRECHVYVSSTVFDMLRHE